MVNIPTLGPTARLALLLTVALALAPSVSAQVVEPSASPADVVVELGTVDPAGMAALLERGEHLVVNVHVPFAGEIAGTDRHIPFDDEEALLAVLPEDPDAPVLLYCYSGRMSRIAGDRLIELGYRNVVHLGGGMNAWRASGRPLEN